MTIERLIGLYSPAPQSGKTFTATVLAHHGFAEVSFAEPLKRMACEFLTSLGYRHDEAARLVWVDKHKLIEECGITARQLLQRLGTEWGRQQISDDIWIRCWQARIKPHRRVITDDVRFLNEAEAVKETGGEVWMIRRSATTHDGQHVSEGALDNWDRFDKVIDNDKSLTDFRRKIDAALWP